MAQTIVPQDRDNIKFMRNPSLTNIKAQKSELFAWFWLTRHRSLSLPGVSGPYFMHLHSNCSRKSLEVISGSKEIRFVRVPRRVPAVRRIRARISQNRSGQWICLDFKALRIEPTHYTIRTYDADRHHNHLESLAVEGSDDGASWTEIGRHKNNWDLKDRLAVKMFIVSRIGNFPRIRLRQTGPNHKRQNDRKISAFEVLGAIARVS
jgi:hypothetical protein